LIDGYEHASSIKTSRLSPEQMGAIRVAPYLRKMPP
jgi:hypothetical protein